MDIQLTTALGKEVPLNNITKELKALFSADTSRTNACLMNFAVYTENTENLHQNFRRIARLTENHTCRALSIALDKDADEESITSWVTAHCNMSNGKKTVCCEQLTFLLKGLVAGRLRNTLFANLNSDLPLVFWWQGDLTPRFEQRLYTLIDRFIFDSSEWSTPKKSYETVLAAATEVQRRFIIQDLAWTRSYYMRVAFASIFDEAIAKKEAENIRSVSVIVGEGYYTTGALLLAWLVRQMKWTLNEKLSEEEFIFETPTGAFVFANLKEEGAVPVSELGVASEVASFLVHQPEGAMYIEQVSQLGENVSHLTTNTGKSDRLSLVADQLARGGSNTLLKKVLPMFLKLLPS